MRAIAFGRAVPSIAIKVITRDGKTYNLGYQKDGKFSKHYTKLIQHIRIKYYHWHRSRSLSGKEKVEFDNQIKKLRGSI